MEVALHNSEQMIPTQKLNQDTRIIRSARAPLRVGLIGGGALFLRVAVQVATSAPLGDTPFYLFAVIAVGGLGLIAIVAAGLRTPPDRLRWLILLAIVSEIGLTALIWRHTQRLHPFSRVDVALYIDMASELVQHGENPYTWDFNGVNEVYRAAQAASTPQLDGSTAGRYDYPALGVLAVLPFEVIGLPGVWLVPLLAQIGMAILIFLAAPHDIQPLILFPLLVWFRFSDLTAVGANDVVWSMLLVGMIVAWRRPTLRAVLYGLAISYKQIPWFLFPFLVMRIWYGSDPHTPRKTQVARLTQFSMVSGLTFLIMNLPFILWNPSAWLEGILTPVTENLVYFSQGGLSGLTTFGYVNLPKGYYLLATLIVLAVLLFIYRRHFSTLRDAFVIMPSIFMWFSYRALVSYWVYWVPPALAILLQREPQGDAHIENPDWLDTMLVAAAAALILAIVGIVLVSDFPLAVEPVPPYLTEDGQVNRILIRLENLGPATIKPRFGVHYDYTGFNPLPWHIESGPLILERGQSGLYWIAGDGELPFVANSAAQVIVTNAEGDYALRGMATIGPDRSFLWPDAIPNPDFLYWNSNATTPILWGSRSEPPGAGKISYANEGGHHSVMLTLNGQISGPKRVALNSFVLMPRKPFGVWVRSDSAPNSKAQYGLEFEDGLHRLTLHFGQRNEVQYTSEQRAIVERAVPTGTWTYQEIDLIDLYQQVGWNLPPFLPSVYRNLDADLRTVDISLFLSSDGTADNARVFWGPIEQDGFGVGPETLMAETLEDVVGYYVRLSERHVAERNYAQALMVLERAQQIVHADMTISARIDEVLALIEVENRP